MECWGLGFGVIVGVALAALMAWRGREALWRRRSDEIHDAARFGWMRAKRSDDDDNANENRS